MKCFYPSGVKKTAFLFTLFFSFLIVNQSVANKVVPVITGVYPSKAYQGDTVLIGGFDLSTTDLVFFGQVQTSYFKVLSDSAIIAVVGAADGITVGAGGNLGVYSPFLCMGVRSTPRIDSVSRYIIEDDYSVLITGKYFLGTTAVAFGGIPAGSFIVLDDTLIYASVGNGGSGSLSITTAAGTSYRPGFTYHPAPPLPYSFSPASGTYKSIINIRGVRFTYATNVTFGGIPAKSFTIISDSLITATLGDGTGGDILVTDSSGKIGNILHGFEYRYLANYPPELSDFYPREAIAGQSIMIKGISLSGVKNVVIGNIYASSFTIISDSLISAIVAAGSTGTQIAVQALEGSDSLNGFTYLNKTVAPVVYNFSPTTAGRGTIVDIYGKNLTNVSSVSFGNIPASYYVVTSDSTISAVVWFGNSGLVTVKTVNEDFSFASGFIYDVSPADRLPEITSFYPTSATQGDTVQIRGRNLWSVAAISFGNTQASSYAVTSDSTMSAVVGFGNSGLITVKTLGGGSSFAPGFIYDVPPVNRLPEITSFYPTSATQGDTVLIRGHNLWSVSAISFGNIQASQYVVTSDSTLFTIVNYGNSGDVTIKGMTGDSSYLPGFIFKGIVLLVPELYDFSPKKGTEGTVITITGKYLTDVNRITIGDIPVNAFTVVSDSVIIATIAEGNSGQVGVRSPYGSAYASPYEFTYVEPANYPQITDFHPKSGLEGTLVTIYGHQLAPVESVTFGGTPASFIIPISDSVLIAIVGGGSTGLLGVTSGYGTTYGSEFVYEAPKPEIYSFSPGIGGEGTIVHILGTAFTNISSVSFGDTPAASFIVNADSLITATVGKGSTGVISVDSAFSSLIFNYINTDSAVVVKTITSYPNPSSGTSWVKHPVSANSKIRVIDMMGNLVKLVTVDPTSAQTQLDITDLKAGYYKVTWSNGSDTRTGTIVVQ